jgi:phage antirepressor YoqD-like protein
VTLLSVKEMAAFLGMTESGIRQVIRRNKVQRKATGHFKAALYAPDDILQHTGTRDRLPKAS